MIRNAILSVSTAFLAAAPPGTSPLDQCASTAVAVCGEGNVCCLCVVGEPPSCSFSCRDGKGNLSAMSGLRAAGMRGPHSTVPCLASICSTCAIDMTIRGRFTTYGLTISWSTTIAPATFHPL